MFTIVMDYEDLNLSNTTQSDTLLKEINDSAAQRNIGAFVFIGMMMILGIVGNNMSFVYHAFVDRRKTVTTFLISALALNDLSASVALVDHIILLRYNLKFENKFGCQFTYFLNNIFVFNSVVLLNPIGIERCLKVCTQNSKYRMTKRGAAITVGVLTLVALVSSFKHFFITGVVDLKVELLDNHTVTARVCSLLLEDRLQTVISITHMIDVIAFILTNIITITVYGIMAKKIASVRRKIASYPANSMDASQTRTTDNASEANECVQKTLTTCNSYNQWDKKLNIMLGIITAGSLLSFLPYFVVVAIVKPNMSVYDYTLNPLVQVGWRSFMLNSVINPYIIVLFNRKFRRFVIAAFHCKMRI